MGRGNPEAWKNLGRNNNNPSKEKIPKKDVNKALNSALYWFKKEEPKTEEEFAERLNEFFQHCAEANEIPTVEKMALALGTYRQKVWEWEVNQTKGRLISDMLKRAKAIISTMDAELAMTGKIQPVVYIFRSKNFYGMRDQVDISASNESGNGGVFFDQRQLENRYAGMVENRSPENMHALPENIAEPVPDEIKTNNKPE